MIGLEITFLAGRYHATPWGRHANEAQPEWPPSPWRILRALVATWKRKCDHLDEASVQELLENLASPPVFCLPPATLSHTRHFMPWFKNFSEKGPNAKTLVFDAFVAVEKSKPLVVFWPDTELSAEQAECLGELARNLSFLGRAETWCRAAVFGEEQLRPLLEDVNAFPSGNASPVRSDESHQVVSVLCPNPQECFSSETTKKLGRGKNASPIYDPDWALCAETLDLHAENRVDPPGAVWVNYGRRKDCFETPLKKSSASAELSTRPQIARFALDSSVLPLVTETLRVAEDARRNLMGWYGKRFDGAASAVFSGKNPDDPECRPLADHGHAYYLPTDEDGDGRLDHLTLVARDGFGRRELDVIDRIRRIKTRDREKSGHSLDLLLVGLGTIADFRPPIFRASTTFVSHTPFVAHQHFKKRGRKRHPPELDGDPVGFLRFLLREELGRWSKRNFGDDIDSDSVIIEPLLDDQGVFRLENALARYRPVDFKRSRWKRGDDGARRLSGFFRITFAEEVSGPLSLGHSCHFGLGLFAPSPTT
ncbi:MAG: type I-U CRISPR-associated protein Csb2 [Verrucomicrobiales bacterium]